MPRFLLPIILIIGITCVAVFLLQDPQEYGATDQPGSADTAMETDGASLLEQEATGNKIATTGDSDASAIEREPAQRQVLEAQPGSVLITVVDDVTGAVIPEATIKVLNPAVQNFQDLITSTQDHEEIVQLMESIPSTYLSYVANEVGQVRIPHPGNFLTVAGRHETYFGSAQDFNVESQEITLLLHDFKALRVKVVDVTGQPVVGVVVAIANDFPHLYDPLKKVKTNAEGIAVFERPAEQRDLFEKGSTPIRLGLEVIAAEPVEAPLDWNDWPSEPITLVCPLFGQVEVLVLSSQGNLVSSGFHVSLEISNEEQQGILNLNFLRGDSISRSIQGKTTRSGRVLYPFVEIQQKMRATTISPNDELRDSQFLSSPNFAGSQTTVTLTPRTQNPILVGRILNDRGMVGRYQSLGAKFEVAGQFLGSEQIKTDDAGEFRLQIKNANVQSGQLTLQLTLKATRNKPKRVAFAQIALPLPTGDTSIGDLILEASPLIAKGRIVDGLGNPISYARVSLEYHNDFFETDQWVPMDWDLSETTDRDGAFEVRGIADQERLRLSASHRDHLTQEQEIVVGQSGIEIQLGHGLSVEGRFLFDPEIDTSLLKINLTRPGDLATPVDDFFSYPSTKTPIARLYKDGTFTIPGCAPGHAILVLKTESTDQELYRIDPLMIPSTGEKHVLEDLDLRGLLTVISLTAVDSLGVKVPGVQIEKETSDWFTESVDKPFTIITKGAVPLITLTAKGWRDTKVENISQDREVVMRKGVSIHVVLANPAVVPDGFQVNATLFPLGVADPSRMFTKSVKLVNMHTEGADALLQSAGSYTVIFQLLPSGESRNRNIDRYLEFPITLDGFPPPVHNWPVIEVQDLDTEQTIQVTLDDSILSALLEFAKAEPNSD